MRVWTIRVRKICRKGKRLADFYTISGLGVNRTVKTNQAYKGVGSRPISERYDFILTTPNPIALRSFSEYFLRAFSASCFDLKGFERGVNTP
jgi:hypothetical protein